MKLTTVKLRECCDMAGAAADASEPVLRGVKVLGSLSENGRRYLPEAIQAALPLYACKVNLDHPAHAGGMRGVKDRFGKLENVRLEGGVPRADLRYNPAHPFAATLRWFAENMPDAIGLSHNAVGQGKTKDGVFVVEKIVSVRSVDIVADPATTKGLYEAMDPELDTAADAAADAPDEGDAATHLGRMILAVFHDDSMDRKEKWAKIKAALKLADAGDAEEEDDEEGKDEPDESHDDDDPDATKGKKDKEEYEEALSVIAKHPVGRKILERLDALEAERATAGKRARALKLCEDARLPKTAVTDLFLESLANAADDRAMKALVEDRKRLVGVRTPVSAGKGGAAAAMDAKAFKKALFAKPQR